MPASTREGTAETRSLFPRSIVGLVAVGLAAVVAFSSFAIVQAGAAGTKESLYDGNRLKPDPTPGGAGPIHDVNGSWAGNLTSERLPIPPMTPLGQKLISFEKRLCNSRVGFSTSCP